MPLRYATKKGGRGPLLPPRRLAFDPLPGGAPVGWRLLFDARQNFGAAPSAPIEVDFPAVLHSRQPVRPLQESAHEPYHRHRIHHDGTFAADREDRRPSCQRGGASAGFPRIAGGAGDHPVDHRHRQGERCQRRDLALGAFHPGTHDQHRLRRRLPGVRPWRRRLGRCRQRLFCR